MTMILVFLTDRDMVRQIDLSASDAIPADDDEYEFEVHPHRYKLVDAQGNGMATRRFDEVTR